MQPNQPTTPPRSAFSQFLQNLLTLPLWAKIALLLTVLLTVGGIGVGAYFGLRKPAAPVSQTSQQQDEKQDDSDENKDQQIPGDEAEQNQPGGQNPPPANTPNSPDGTGRLRSGTPSPAPTPPPSSPPPTTPPPTTPPPPSSGFPNASNTGTPAGTSLTNYTGPGESNTSNLVLDGINFPDNGGEYVFNGNNITIRNSYVHSSLLFRGDNITVERTTLLNGASFSGTGGVTFRYNNINNFKDDALHVTADTGAVTNVNISANFINTAMPRCGAHADGLHVRGVNGLTVAGNTFDMSPWRQICGLDALNSAIFLQTANGGNSNVTVNGNYLNGGSYIMYIDPGSNLRVTNNAFGSDKGYGVVNNTSNPGNLVDKSGNYFLSGGAPVNF